MAYISNSTTNYLSPATQEHFLTFATVEVTESIRHFQKEVRSHIDMTRR